MKKIQRSTLKVDSELKEVLVSLAVVGGRKTVAVVNEVVARGLLHIGGKIPEGARKRLFAGMVLHPSGR